jgi:hypothetical protein
MVLPDHAVLGREVVLDVDAELALGRSITNMDAFTW